MRKYESVAGTVYYTKHFKYLSTSSSSFNIQCLQICFISTKKTINNNNAYFFSVGSVLKTVQGCGDYDRLAQGVFENYLNMKIKDSSMVSVSIVYLSIQLSFNYKIYNLNKMR